MKRLLIIALVIAAINPMTLSAFAAGDVQSVQSLHQSCKKETATGSVGFCVGYVFGVGTMMGANGALSQESSTEKIDIQNYLLNGGYCPEPPATGGAMVQAFINWAEKHPERWSEDMSVGVIAALSTTWPCKIQPR